MRVFTLLFALLCLAANGFSQSVYFPINQEFNQLISKKINAKSSSFHTAMRPYIYSDLDSVVGIDSLYKKEFPRNNWYLMGTTKWSRTLQWVEKRIYSHDFITLKDEAFKAHINPLLDLSLGWDSISGTQTFLNSRGIAVDGQIGKKFFFYSNFIESQANFLPYLNANINSTLVVPGQGRQKIFKNNAGYDFNRANALLSYSPSKYFNFQFGQDKLFLGDGYRSILLSDNAFNYPFFKITSKFWKIQYTNIYAQFVGRVSAADQLFPKKYGSFHYLSWNATKWLNLSLFEGIIWSGANGRGYDWQYLNPIIFLRPVEFANGSSDNAVMGATGKIKLTGRWHLYGQLMVDELNFQKVKNSYGWWGNKWGIQAGTKMHDLFTIKNLTLQMEANIVRPYTYTHFDSLSNYSHFNQALAHPLGANFMEYLSLAQYRYKRFFIDGKIIYATVGLDSNATNYGQNIFYSYNTNKAKISGENGEYGHTIGQGRITTLVYTDIKIAYLFNPRTNMRLEMGWMTRKMQNSVSTQLANYFYIGFKTSLFNYYYDF